MNVDFSTELRDGFGEPMRMMDDDEEVFVVTLGWACITALNQSYKGEENLDAAKKIERWNLCGKILKKAGPNPEYATFNPNEDQRVLLKDLLNKRWSAPIVAQGHKLLTLDGKEGTDGKTD